MLKLIFCINGGMGFDPAEYMEKAIAELRLGMKTVKVCAEPSELLRFSATADPADFYLLFLSDGFDGADMTDNILRVRASLHKVFTICFSENRAALLDAVNHNAMPSGFLSREVSKKEFSEAVSKVYSYYIGLVGQMSRKFTVVVGKRLYSFAYSEIMSFEAREKKIFLTTQNTRFTFYDSLAALETRIGPSFVRCHHAFIINREAITEINFQQNYLKLANGADIPLSTTYKKNLLKVLEYYALNPRK